MSVPAGSVFEKMLRAVFVSAVLVGVGGPALADGMDACRDRQTKAKARLGACESVIAAGQVSGKDLAIAYDARGNAFRLKRNYDKALAAFEAAHAADPDNPNYINGRGLAYEGKGDDAHAMADYNLVLQMRPNAPAGAQQSRHAVSAPGCDPKCARRFQRVRKCQSESLCRALQSRARADDQQGL